MRSQMRCSIVSMVVWSLLLSVAGGGAFAATSESPSLASAATVVEPQQQEDKAEKERRKQEEKVAKNAIERQQKRADIMDEIQPDVDALAVTLAKSVYSDRFLQDYVNEMGQRLVPKETPSGLLFSFRVLDDPTPNAMALPDGRVYVNSGLLVFVRNEAQLAAVLGHEIGHVIEDHAVKSIQDSRSFKKRVLPGLIGAAIGATVGALTKGKEGAAAGAAIGAVGGAVVSIISANSYSRQQEEDADRLGTRLAMDRGYDPKEAVAFFDHLSATFGDGDRFSNLLWGDHARNTERAAYLRRLLDNDLAASYNAARSAGSLTLGSGQMQLFASRMFRDVAIAYMDEYDCWDIAKKLLEAIIDYRARDPRTLWALGRVYKMVGRTDAERSRALDYLQRAAATDERGRYPFIYRDLGLMQARMGVETVPAAVESLKRYVRGHVDRYEEEPPDLDEMYDYLLVFGDSQWTAPRVDRSLIRAASTPSAPPLASPEIKEKPPVKAVVPVVPKKKGPGIGKN